MSRSNTALLLREQAPAATPADGVAPAGSEAPEARPGADGGTGAAHYRGDIAGLRAIAVLPILLFHAGVTALPGGFIGVDIFFVISGYLITTIILREMDAGEFSMIEFYRRRTARIVPALAVVLLATLAAGAVLLLPFELADLGKSTSSAALFVSNFYFMSSADYFGGAAESKPLLHTWSLAVEEQFYIFYPLGLLLLSKWFRRRLKLIVTLGVAASLAAAFVLAEIKPDAGFYLIVPRAWELGLGALVALGAAPAIRSPLLRNALTLASLAAIAFGCVFITAESPFPAPWALVPVLATAVLIAYGRQTVSEGLLAAAPMRFVGDISYSLYLWHWPVITFYRLRTGVHLEAWETVMLVAASIALAWASYRFIERPWLRRLRAGVAWRVAAGGLAVLAAIAGVALLTGANASRIGQYPKDIERIATYIGYSDTEEYAYQYFDRDQCLKANRSGPASTCLPVDPARRNVLIFGDSHATQYWRAFAEKHPDQNVMKASTSGCRPTVDTYGLDKCTEMVRYILNELSRGDVQSVVLAGRWRPADIPLAARTVEMLRRQGVKVTVIGPMVEYDGDYPLILARARLQGDEGPPAAMRLSARRDVDRAMRPVIEAAGATYVSAQDLECPGGDCVLFAPDGAPLHFDYGHLTLGGARYMVARMPAP